MDFSVIFQLRTKKFWWMDVIFYFVISLLVATVFCYFIFWFKNNLQREDIKNATAALETVGTSQQRGYEQEVITYQKKINDFTNLLQNHEFAANVFAFMQAGTMPNIWFKQFSLDKKNRRVQLSGEADTMDAFSRQVASLEKNEYVTNVTALNSSLGTSARIGFNINLTLDQSIFSYVAEVAQENLTVPLTPETPSNNAPENTAPGTPPENGQPAVAAKSSEKLITSFHILLSPEVIGTIDETNYTIDLEVPYNTDVKNLVPSIIISTGASVLPASGTPQNFANAVTYIVTAEDGSTQNYKVQVTVLAQPTSSGSANAKSSQSQNIILIVIAISAVVVVALVIFLSLKKRSKNKMSKIGKV